MGAGLGSNGSLSDGYFLGGETAAERLREPTQLEGAVCVGRPSERSRRYSTHTSQATLRGTESSQVQARTVRDTGCDWPHPGPSYRHHESGWTHRGRGTLELGRS